MSLRLGRCLCFVVLCAAIVWLAAPQSGQSQAPKPKIDPAKAVVVKNVTIEAKDWPLSKALQTVQGQTGIEVRRGTEDDPTIKELKLKNVSFWQALDEIAKAADVRVSLYQRDGKIALVPGPYREVPTSYSGPFRITLKKLIALRDLETGAHGCLAKIEVAWQPPFQPFLLETQPETFSLKDDKGLDQELPPLEKSAGYVGNDRHAIEIDVALPALRRNVARIGLLKGSLKMIGSAKTLNFEFTELKKAKKEQEGVNVEITNFDAKVNEDKENFWTLEVRLKYPPSTIKESHQISDWLVRSRPELVRKGGMRLRPNAGFDSDPESTTIRYRWVDDLPKLNLGKTSEWKFEYITPGPVIEVPIPFEFKDVPLP